MVLLQAVLFNHICLFNIAVPFVFITFIMRLPLSININLLIALSFFTGLSVDVFSDTQGMNALACTAAPFYRSISLAKTTWCSPSHRLPASACRHI